MRTLLKPAVILLAALVVTSAAAAQIPGMPHVASVAASASPQSVAPGSRGKLTIHLVVAPGFHVNSAKPNDPSLIATVFSASRSAGIVFGAPRYPKAVAVHETGYAKPISAYVGSVNIVVPFTIARGTHPASLRVGGVLTYQGCNRTSCYPPKSESVAATIRVK